MDSAVITIRAVSVNSSCPSCGAVSGRIHTSAAKRPTPTSSPWPKKARRSRRSYEAPATTAGWRERCFGERSDVFRVRSSSLESYLPWLDEQWAAGRRNGSELWRSLKQRGFRGRLRVVSEWSARRRRSERMDASAISRAPSARTIARLMTTGATGLAETGPWPQSRAESNFLSKARSRRGPAGVIRRKTPAELAPWIERAKTRLVVELANGVTKDKAAVSVTLFSSWSNGQASKGQICKLKLVKRQMYGRGKLDLFQARVIGAT